MSEVKQIYCPLRREWVLALPEEVVRVKLISYMLDDLHFPKELMAIEKSLQQLPQVVRKVPLRRVDLICYAKNIHPEHDLYPLLLVECKAVPLTQKAIDQVIGYNHFLKACFICVVNQEELRFGRIDPKENKYQFSNELPTYTHLKSRMDF